QRYSPSDSVARSRWTLVVLIWAAAAVALYPALSLGQTPKQISITFDELPAAQTFGDVDRKATNYLLLDALKRHEVKATGFVVGNQIEGSYDILGEWLNQGHALGNMTWSGQDFNELGPDQFIADVQMGSEALEPMLSGFGQKKRYFRYPFLHYGDTQDRRSKVARFLKKQGWTVCPATVLPEDYLYDLNLIKLGKQPDSVKYHQLMNDYINHVLDELEREERLATNLAGRPVRQILELRANRLNAVCLDELLGALHDAGYGFISLNQALKDEVYGTPEAYYGLKGLGYLDMIDQSNPDLTPAD
ncbi:MAG: polysaccharide deacetylase family protein, partial [candidate division Zixibacteria bacterium]|nr:polysaccharide deacetylase family protein [candidate division Zixibacteria bacterium]